jgi:hypothetical protein
VDRDHFGVLLFFFFDGKKLYQTSPFFFPEKKVLQKSKKILKNRHIFTRCSSKKQGQNFSLGK